MGRQIQEMSSVQLILARHGRTEWNDQLRYIGWQDVDLNDAGRRQAEALARHLSGRLINVIYASDLKRAAETAAAIGRNLDMSVTPDPRLREACFGVLEGLTFNEAQVQFPDMIGSWLADGDRPPTGAESFSDFGTRVDSFLEHLKTGHDDQTVLVVSHGGVIREILRQSLDLPPKGHWYFKIDNASLTEITLYEKHTMVSHLNDVHYLQGIVDDG